MFAHSEADAEKCDLYNAVCTWKAKANFNVYQLV